MRSEDEIREELETIKVLKKYTWDDNKYRGVHSAVSGIQFIAQQEILEWVLQEDNQWAK